MAVYSGPQHRGASRTYRIRRQARAVTRLLDRLEREHADTTEPERDCE